MEFLRELNDFQVYNGNYSRLQSDYVYKYALPAERLPLTTTKEVTFFLQRNWLHTITISIIYYATMRVLQRAMRDRPAFSLQKPLFFWNAALALFSIAGVTRQGEDFLESLVHRGLYDAICKTCHPNDVAAFWSFLFAISKIVELGDTLFIVLRKKPLIFLHYYHHAAVLIYTVHSGAEHTAPGRAFIFMNYFAHSVMYSYYAATAAGRKFPRWVSMCVTTIQTTQMFLGVAISIGVYIIKEHFGMPCQQSMANLYLAFLIYFTFAVLFIQFFINAYLVKKTSRAVKDKKAKKTN